MWSSGHLILTVHEKLPTLYCVSFFRRPVDTENGWRRVECVIMCPSGGQSQSLAAKSFNQQIIAVLKARKFSIAGSEVASRKELLLELA